MTDAPYVKLSEVMTQPVHTIDRMATAHVALTTLDESGVNSLVIERRDPSDEIGKIVISYIAREVIAKNRAPDRVNVYKIINKPVLTLDRDINIKYGISLLERFGESRSLVVDRDRQLLGIVTLRDVMVHYAHVEEGVP